MCVSGRRPVSLALLSKATVFHKMVVSSQGNQKKSKNEKRKVEEEEEEEEEGDDGVLNNERGVLGDGFDGRPDGW